MKTLSKSRFVSGVQCEKKLLVFLLLKRLQLPTDEQTQAIFDLGHQIGNLAQNRFPNGKDATPEDFSGFSPSFKKPNYGLQKKVETIYEATFTAKMHFVCLIFYIE